MSKSKFHLIALATIISSIVLFSSCLDLGSDKSRNVLINANAMSQNQKYIATFYGIMGGGAAGWCYAQVGVRKRDEQFDPDKGFVFQASCSQRINELEMKWEKENKLKIIYPSDVDVYKQERVWSNNEYVEISYEKK